MRHGNANKKLGRERNQRRSLMKSLARSLVLKEKIKTTETKAKFIRPYVEKLITYGKENTLSASRLIIPKIGTEGAKKIIGVLGPRYKDRKGGYTRITKLPRRPGDGAKTAIIEFI